MTREDIIRMAREAGFMPVAEDWFECFPEEIERFAKMIHTRGYMDGWSDADKAQKETALFYKQEGAEEERKACAKVCEESNDMCSSYGLAQAIRARGQQ